jgi:ferric-dicitrate binding protein FerR (iron transport regulator)
MLARESTPAELDELQALLREHPEEQYFIELLSEYWRQPEQLPDQEKIDLDTHFRRVLELGVRKEEVPEEPMEEAFALPDEFSSRKRRIWKMSVLATAACALFAVCLVYLYPRRPVGGNPVPPSRNREVAVKPGAKSRLLLPDGSTVWLNSDSRLTYNSNFNSAATREVNLEGEAFFDVNKSTRPFIVHSCGIDIRVLGTVFDIKSYPKESTFEATLIRGKIEVHGNNPINGASIVLKPHQKLTLVKFPKGSDSMFVHLPLHPARPGVNPGVPPAIKMLSGKIPDSSVVETAWVYNKLVFDGETFGEITARMERWFNVKIEIRDEEVSALRFHARFENETIGEVLRSLQVTAPFDYEINEETVIISAKKSLARKRNREMR